MRAELGATGIYTRTVNPDQIFYAQVTASTAAGEGSTAFRPVPAPIIRPTRMVSAPRGRLLRQGYAVWRWQAAGAVQYRVASWVDDRSQVVEATARRVTQPTYRLHLRPGLKYYITVQAVANDGRTSVSLRSPSGLLYRPVHRVTGLAVRRSTGDWLRWTWNRQPGATYRVLLLRYRGHRASILLRMMTGDTHLSTPPLPSGAGDFLEVWAVDAGGDSSRPALLHRRA